MGRFIAFLYGLVAYAVFFVTFLYAIGFVTGLVVPKTIDTGAVVPLAEAIIVDLLLMSAFAIQHSVMARPPFKAWFTQYVPKPVERSTYVLFASLLLVLLFWQWRPLPDVIWHIDQPQVAMAVMGLSFVGFRTVLSSTFLIRSSTRASSEMTSEPPQQRLFKGNGTGSPPSAATSLSSDCGNSGWSNPVTGRTS